MRKLTLIVILWVNFLLLIGVSEAVRGTGWASCYGDYPKVLSPNSVVSSGLGSFIQGEDWTYTTALCSNWANTFAGACFSVECTGGAGTSGGMKCKNAKTYVRVIDTLGNDCSGNPVHVFDLNDTPFDQLGTDGASCSGYYGVTYSSVSCQSAGIVKGGIKIGLPPNQVDPWCPAFVFSNVGGSGALHSVSVSPDGGSNWYSYRRNSFNGARWDCQSGSGKYLGKSLSFKMTVCQVDGVPSACNPDETITITNALPANWCGASSVPCNPGSFQPSLNFGSGAQIPSQEQPPQNSQPRQEQPHQQNGGSVRCGTTWNTADGTCGTPCKTNDDCPSGQTCFADVSLDPCQKAPPRSQPPAQQPPAQKPPAQKPPVQKGSGKVRCGSEWTKANSECGTTCSTNNDCPSGQYCFAGLSEDVCNSHPAQQPPVQQPPVQQSPGKGIVRCGIDWASANSGCGTTCKTNNDCPTGQTCFGDLSETPCKSGNSGNSGNSPVPVIPPSNPIPSLPTTGDGCGVVVTHAQLQAAMERPGDNLAHFVDPLNYALKKYSMDCPNRIISFLSQVRHETASLTVFHQPVDNGAGSLHMVPSNWGYMCEQVPEIKQLFSEKFSGCGNCECLKAMAENPFSADATKAAKEIFAQPLAAFLSGTWWFTQGSSIQSLLGWKGCGDLRKDSDIGIGGPGAADCRHSGYHQVTCCVFFTIGGSAGLPQRLAYYEVAKRAISGGARAIDGNYNNFDQNPNSAPRSDGISPFQVIVLVVGTLLFAAVVAVIVVAQIKKRETERREETV